MKTKLVIFLIAFLCALVGLFIIYYGYTAVYSLSGFTSIFIGAATLVFAYGLTKGHQIARIGALFIFITSMMGCVWWLYIIFQQQANKDIVVLEKFDYLCIVYTLSALTAIILLCLPSINKFFTN